MGLSVEPHDNVRSSSALGETTPDQVPLVHEELQRILNSRFFKNATRSRQFLEFVVSRKLDGHAGELKERTIGTELFQRAPGYATGDDPVVRVQAGEVRRRLEQFYQTGPNHAQVRIELPIGSYSPHFVWADSNHPTPPEAASTGPVVIPRRHFPLRTALLAGFAFLALAFAFVIYIRPRSTSGAHESRAEQFWSPALATQQPVLICLAKPVVYRPTGDLYRRYSEQHPGTFRTEVERSNQVLPLRPGDKISWSDFAAFSDYGVAVGDVYAAVQISGLLGKLGKASQVRIGSNYSFEDLRNSPSVVVGAFNNKWTMQLSPNLHFEFIEDGGQLFIREQGSRGRKWFANLHETSGEDYAIVARLLDSSTGQFTIVAAGITGSGTQTAGEFVSRPEFLDKALKNAPSDWQKKSMELILRTTITDSVAGPPRVVEAYYW
jgi:hypothetical protein